MNKNIIVNLIGPSAIGKTLIALKLSNIFKFEIINTDSVMIYKSMDIGVGKPLKYEMKKYKHNIVDILNIDNYYSVFQFCIDAFFFINKSLSKKKIPFLVGGNIMYNWFFQKHYISKYHTSILHTKKKVNFLNLVIIPIDKKNMNIYIKRRLLNMFRSNFINEVKNIYNIKKFNLKLPAINTIGYKDIWLYLDNKISFTELKYFIIKSTNILSKKQITWIKNLDNLFFIESKSKYSIKKISDLIKKYLFGEHNVKSKYEI